METIIEKLKEIFCNFGIDIDSQRNVDIESIDSISFVSIIIEIENYFDIAFPDELLNIDSLSSLDYLSQIIYFEIEKNSDR